MQTRESYGLVLNSYNYREGDKLVKIFTETNGKHMFFVNRSEKSRFNIAIQPLTVAKFMIKINDKGLSFIEDYKEVNSFKKINIDLFKLSYASYVVSLADVALFDGEIDSSLFAFLHKTLVLMEEGLDYEILTNVFEIQLLNRFGVNFNWNECSFCHRANVPFDFSYRYSGLLCPDHYDKDTHRSYIDPNVLYLVNHFQSVRLDDLKKISVKIEMKRKLRLFIDAIYDNYIGLNLKSKKFIDDLETWGTIMK